MIGMAGGLIKNVAPVESKMPVLDYKNPAPAFSMNIRFYQFFFSFVQS